MNGTGVVDVAIAGAGIIGLSLALELRKRGLSVTVMERGQAMCSASWAAGGMLAVNDPQNPAELMPLCVRSWELYPSYLDRVQSLSGLPVPLRTCRTLQEARSGNKLNESATATEIAQLAPGLNPTGHRFVWLDEGSVDPNDLRAALPAALRVAGGRLLEATEVLDFRSADGEVLVETRQENILAKMFVNCCGAWAGGAPWGGVPVEPVKGHMANVRCEPDRLRCVVRTLGVYLVPRGDGRVTVGATLEHVGFDEVVHEPQVSGLMEAALRLLPEASIPSPIDAWTGLRPGTPDGLPILGRAQRSNCWHATGHYRDGILLAPVTARVMAQAMLGETPDVPLEPFAPTRFKSK
ncbi:MAG TPA: FAD-dependent oxidoreductase [Acidobacteriaceae bacterium]|nr:FAD-dependent oxidoreductase [Acidobacteriaceae bacterium]